MRAPTSDEPASITISAAVARPVADRAAVAEPAPDPRGAGMPRWVVIGAVIVGVALRLVIVLSPLGRPDSDEVIAALMARHIGDDGFPTFFWGQQYGGTLELVGVAASLKVFGWSVAALRVPTVVLSALNAVLVWRIGRYWLTERQAQLAGLLLWLGPPAAVWFGVREQLFYTPTITFGLVMGLAAYRVRSTGRVRSYALGGLALGLGIWTSAMIAFFVLPAAVVALGGRRLAGRWRELLIGVPVAATALVVGASPFLLASIRTGGAPLHVGESFPVTGTGVGRVRFFVDEAFAGALGLRTILTHEWIAGWFGRAAYVAVLGVLAWSLVRSWPRRTTSTALGWGAVGLIAYPFIYARIPFAMDDPNLRYTVFAVPFVALVLVRVVRSSRAALVTLALTLAVTTVGLVRLHTISEVDDDGVRIANVGDLGPAVAVLEREGIDAAYAEYWVAHRITFDTEERVIGASAYGLPRDPASDELVRRSRRSAWVVDRGRQLDEMQRALERLDVEAEVIEAGELAVVIPEHPVAPDELPEAARHRT